MQAIPAALAATGITSTTLAVASAGMTAIAGVQAAGYKAQVARNNAQIAVNNAERVVQEAAIDAQETDLAARQELGALLAAQGASGLNMSVGSMGLRRKSKEELAAKDRANITYNAATQAGQYRQQASDFREEARTANREKMFAVVEGGLSIGRSLISGASKVNEKKARSLAA